MSIFKNLFGSKKEPNSRDIVYEFADIMGQLSNPILDTVLLRRPKEQIYNAFDYYIGCLQAMAVNSRDARDELEQVKSLRVRIADFQDIDPEDKAIVSDINAGRRFERFRSARSGADFGEAGRLDPEAFKLWGSVQQKYARRTLVECQEQAR
jgi:hypothetical protein